MLTGIDHLCKEDRSPSVCLPVYVYCVFLYLSVDTWLSNLILNKANPPFFPLLSVFECPENCYITLMYDYFYHYFHILSGSYLLSGHLHILHPVSRWEQFSGLMQRLQVVGHQR